MFRKLINMDVSFSVLATKAVFMRNITYLTFGATVAPASVSQGRVVTFAALDRKVEKSIPWRTD